MPSLTGASSIAFLATAGFAIFEAVLDQLLASVDPATLFVLRAVVTLPILLLMLSCAGRSLTAEIRRLGACPLHWARGLAWSATAFLTILAFWNTASLTETYALMLLHPLWTAAFASLVTKGRQDCRPYRWPFALLAAGLVLYGFGDGIDPRSPWSYLVPIAAGAAFALTNLVGVRIKQELAHDAMTKNVGAVVAAILVSPLVLLVTPPLAGFELRIDPSLVTSHSMLPAGLLIVAAASIALLANIGISHAFDIARNPAVVAAIDSAIIAMGVALDCLLNPAFDLDAYLGLRGVGMLAMTAGAIWAAAKLESHDQRVATSPAGSVARAGSLRPAGNRGRRLVAGPALAGAPLRPQKLA